MSIVSFLLSIKQVILLYTQTPIMPSRFFSPVQFDIIIVDSRQGRRP